MNRGYNFGAGPAMLPEELLLEAQAELLNWQGMGMSVMEIGHRTEEFVQLMNEADLLLRSLLAIPDTYHILFLGSPARMHFGMIPLNFIKDGQQAGYLISGLWSSMAYDEAKRVKKAYCIASGEKNSFLSVPPESEWVFQENSAYLYYTPNETVNGIRSVVMPKQEGIPLVADMTSCLLSEPIDINDYGLIFAGAQKNIANAGLTIVIVRKDWLNTINDNSITTMLDYRTHATHKSLYATPPTFNCYMALKMFQWIKRQGGVAALYENNKNKASKIYNYIDASSFYRCNVAAKDRSIMNVCFTAPNQALDDLFIKKANDHGLFALKGHRVVGGLRASLYNAMPLEGVDALISFMEDFAKKH